MMNINRTDNYNPDYVVHPGATLEETLQSVHMSQSELAKRISRPEKTISEIINGTCAITPETAIQLERALGVDASFWNKLEKNYQEQKARIEAEKNLKPQYDLLMEFPYYLMAKLKWVEYTKDKKQQVKNLLSYFSVNSLDLVNNVMQINYRKYNSKNISEGAVAAWLRKGEIDAQKIETETYDEKMLKSYLSEFRRLSKSSIEEFAPILIEKLSKCGIALVFTQDLPKTYICGASRWLSANKALIQLSMRGRHSDIMWFTLFHEIGHIILHSKKERFIDIDPRVKSTAIDNVEDEADSFSSETLIPTKLYKDFKANLTAFSSQDIRKFASDLDIHPGIIVGRLQHDRIIGFNKFNELRDRYIWQNP